LIFSRSAQVLTRLFATTTRKQKLQAPTGFIPCQILIRHNNSMSNAFLLINQIAAHSPRIVTNPNTIDRPAGERLQAWLYSPLENNTTGTPPPVILMASVSGGHVGEEPWRQLCRGISVVGKKAMHPLFCSSYVLTPLFVCSKFN